MLSRFLKLFFVSLFLVLSAVSVVSAASSLSGRVLLQVESRGEAWYVNPLNGKRYFLGRAADAAKIIRALGLGVTNKDLAAWKVKAPARLSGRILLQVEARGEAYYVNPSNLQLVYLGSPETAFAIWNKLALGTSNKTLATIAPEFNVPTSASATLSTGAPISSAASVVVPIAVGEPYPNQTGREVFAWKYKGKEYSLSLALNQKLYNDYAQSSKVYKYYGDLPENWHEDYYKMFLTPKSADTTIVDLAKQFKYIAAKEGMSDDEMVNLLMAFVQTIPYDHAKNLETGTPNYPYETLFRRLGVCSDKTFLAVMILRELGYGAAVIDLPEVNHAAVGIACPEKFAVFNSGYCYAETTNFFPVGVVPQNFSKDGVVLDQGAEELKGQFTNVFKTGQLGRPEIVQKTRGKEYGGVQATYDLVARMRQLEADLLTGKLYLDRKKTELGARVTELANFKAKMDEIKSNDITKYNSWVAEYNLKVNDYNEVYAEYKVQSDIYNGKVNLYNELIVGFYPSK